MCKQMSKKGNNRINKQVSTQTGKCVDGLVGKKGDKQVNRQSAQVADRVTRQTAK